MQQFPLLWIVTFMKKPKASHCFPEVKKDNLEVKFLQWRNMNKPNSKSILLPEKKYAKTATYFIIMYAIKI